MCPLFNAFVLVRQDRGVRRVIEAAPAKTNLSPLTRAVAIRLF